MAKIKEWMIIPSVLLLLAIGGFAYASYHQKQLTEQKQAAATQAEANAKIAQAKAEEAEATVAQASASASASAQASAAFAQLTQSTPIPTSTPTVPPFPSKTEISAQVADQCTKEYPIDPNTPTTGTDGLPAINENALDQLVCMDQVNQEYQDAVNQWEAQYGSR